MENHKQYKSCLYRNQTSNRNINSDLLAETVLFLVKSWIELISLIFR